MPCNHTALQKRTDHAICLDCSARFSLQFYYKWLRDKEQKKEQQKKKPQPPKDDVTF